MTRNASGEAAPSTAPTVTMRQLTQIDEYRACQDVQRAAFRLADESYVVPIATMVGANLHGGLVHGAFLDDPGGERLAGFSFAFLGRVRGRLCLYSQITAVDPNVQAGGIGTRLKLFQRDWACGQGLDMIAWAFDPLQAMNAHLNLNKLGATVASYVENMYGPRTDGLSRGQPSDRLIVEWPTDPDEAPPLPTGDLPRAVLATAGPDGLVRVASMDLALSDPALLLEIPEEIVRVKEADTVAGVDWHDSVRAAFKAYLPRGYTARTFLRREEDGIRRCYYVLRQSEPA